MKYTSGDGTMNFVFDLDGTICFQGRPVSEPILKCLENINREGHQVIFASARPIRDLLPILPTRFHSYPMIGGNGSLLYKNGKLLHSVCFPNEQIEDIKRLIHKYSATYLIDGEWNYAYTGSRNHPILQHVDPYHLAEQVEVQSLEKIIKVLLLSASDFSSLDQELQTHQVVIHKHKNENVLDISPQGIHKWSALRELGIPEQEYIAFGNDANDITMFQHAKHTVMIGHHESLAVYANESIPHTEDIEERIIEKVYGLAKNVKVELGITKS